jgi:putative MATE family efflux protein
MDAKTSDDTASAPLAASKPARGGDLTQGPITRSLLLFSLPQLGGNALQSLNGTVNQIWVSHILGETAITALGNANIIMIMMLSSIFGVGMAANILIAQARGAGDPARVKRVMGTGATFFVGLSTVMAVAGVLLSPTLLALMRTPIEARADAVAYLRIIFLAVPAMNLFMFLQMAQRGVGDSVTPFWFLALAIVIDIALNPLLILGIGPFPRLGIAGSATSTLVGQGVALLAMLAWLRRRDSILVLRGGDRRFLRPNRAIMAALISRGLPMGLQMIVMSGAAVVMISFVNRFGALTSAAYSISSIIWGYLQMPSMALSASVSSMAAQNIGAQRWDRVARVARAGVISGLVVTGAVALLLYVFNDQVLSILLPRHSPAIPVARHINTTVLWAFVMFSITFSLSGVVRATGAVWAPMAILVAAVLLVRIPFVVLLMPRYGADAIWWSFPMGTVTAATLTTLYYRFGGWRRARMMAEPPAEALKS